MSITLTQKERMFLEDLQKQEGICIEKYNNSSGQAQDAQLKTLFTQLASEEQHHFDTLGKLLQGQAPDMSQGHSQPQQPNAGAYNHKDYVLCSDLLSTEKYVSSTYNTAVFESANPTVRQAVQHIQQDEQKHGEYLFNYMNIHGMYNIS